MRVTHVIGSCSSGGAENFVKNLLVELKTIGCDVDLWVMSRMHQVSPSKIDSLNYEKKYIDYLSSYDIPVRFVEKTPRKDWLKTREKLAFFWKERNSQVVHSHLSSVTFHVCMDLHRFKVPIIQTIHSNHIDYPLLQRLFLRPRCAGIVSISNAMTSILERDMGLRKNQITIIPNGVSLPSATFSVRQVKPVVTNIIAVGRLTVAKDYPTLLKAFSCLIDRLKREGAHIPCLQILGDGELKEGLKSLSESLGLGGHVSWLGLRPDVPDLLAEADIFVMSSAWEGLSIAVLEALAAGLPTVVTEAGGNREMVENGKNGFVVPIGDPLSIADGLYRLIVNRELRESFSIAARIKAVSFSIRECAKRHIALYKGVVSR